VPHDVVHGRWPTDCAGKPVGDSCVAFCDCNPDECYARDGCPVTICQDNGLWCAPRQAEQASSLRASTVQPAALLLVAGTGCLLRGLVHYKPFPYVWHLQALCSVQVFRARRLTLMPMLVTCDVGDPSIPLSAHWLFPHSPRLFPVPLPSGVSTQLISCFVGCAQTVGNRPSQLLRCRKAKHQ
jgi:hypothetical protein